MAAKGKRRNEESRARCEMDSWRGIECRGSVQPRWVNDGSWRPCPRHNPERYASHSWGYSGAMHKGKRKWWKR